MHKKFIRNLIWVLFLNLLIKPFWILGIDRAVQNQLGAEAYGMYFAIFNFSFLLNVILDFGITNFNNKNIAQNNHLLRKHLSNIIVLKFLLAIVYLVLTLICALFIKYSIDQIRLLLVLAFNQFLISFVLYLRSNLSGLHLFAIDSVISVLDRTIMIIICSLLLWGNFQIKMTLEIFVWSQTLAYFLTAFITMAIVFNKAKSKFLRLNWNYPFFLMIIKQSLPFAVLVLLMTFYNRIDTVMLERMLPNGAEQSGIYASAYRLLDASNMIAFLFAGLLLPIFSKMIKLKNSVESLSKTAFTLVFILSTVVAIVCYAYNFEIMSMLYKQHIGISAKVFSILMFCFVPISTTYIFGTLLTANGNLKELNIIASCGMILNITLNFILIPKYQVVGAACSSLVTQLLSSGVQVILARKVFKFHYNFRYLSAILIYSLFIFGITVYSHNISYPWINKVFIIGVISVLLVFILRLLRIRDVLLLFKRS